MAEPLRKKKKGDGITLPAEVVTLEPPDPLYFMSRHPKKPAPVDLHCFAIGMLSENADSRVKKKFVSFTGRPILIQELAPVIRGKYFRAPATSIKDLANALRWWWRFLDRIATTSPPVNSVVDFDDIHYAAYRIEPGHRGYASLFFALIDEARQALNLSRPKEKPVHLLHWTAIEKATGETNLISSEDAKRMYHYLKRPAFAALRRYGEDPSAVPTKRESMELHTLFILNSGWNPQTTLDIDVDACDSDGNLKCIVAHPQNPQFTYVKSRKERARGAIQFALSRNKSALSPANIILALVKQTAPLRERLRSYRAELMSQLADSERVGRSGRTTDRLRGLIADAERDIRSPWLYAHNGGDIARMGTTVWDVGSIPGYTLSFGVDDFTERSFVRGLIETVDLEASQFTVLGITVTVNAGTVCDGVVGCNGLRSGEGITVYGYAEYPRNLTATRIVREPFDSRSVCLTGIVSISRRHVVLKTEIAIVDAIKRLEANGSKLNPATVARAAGVSSSTLYRFPEIVQSLRVAKEQSASGNAPSPSPDGEQGNSNVHRVQNGMHNKAAGRSFQINGVQVQIESNVPCDIGNVTNGKPHRVVGILSDKNGSRTIIATDVQPVLSMSGPCLKLWAQDINRKLQPSEKPVAEDIVMTDLRDAFISWRWRTRHSWLDAMLAAGHGDRESLLRYLNKKQHKDESRRDFIKVGDAIWDTIVRTRGNACSSVLPTIVAAKIAKASEEQIQRWIEGRDATYVGTGCADFKNPPKQIEPEHRQGDGCRVQRCMLCPHAILLPNSHIHLAKRLAELRYIQSIIPVSSWVDSDYQEEMGNTESALENYDQTEVLKLIRQWESEIAAGRHRPIIMEGSHA